MAGKTNSQRWNELEKFLEEYIERNKDSDNKAIKERLAKVKMMRAKSYKQ